MKRTIAILILMLFALQSAVFALDAGEAKQDWLDAKKTSQEKKEIHNDAKVDFAADKSEENRQKVVDTGKDLLNAVLDEAQAWLEWKNLEVEENDDVPQDLKDEIQDDVDANLVKVDELRSDVDGVTNQLELGLVFLKMIGKYAELLSDVARNSGNVWVYIADQRIEKIESFESKLRDAAGDNEDVLEYLDEAQDAIEEAKGNVEKAESSYSEVKVPGTPLIKFAEGNNYLRTARTNLLDAHAQLGKAYRELVRGE